MDEVLVNNYFSIVFKVQLSLVELEKLLFLELNSYNGAGER